MTWRIGAVAIAVAAVCSGSAARGTSNPTSSAVEVWAEGCTPVPNHGSGVAIGGDLVATAAHVVAGARSLRLVEPGGRAHTAAIAAIDTLRDVAVLHVSGLDRPHLAMRVLAAGDKGTFLGFGGAASKVVDFTVTRAVSILSEDIYVRGEHSRPGYELAADVVAGDSGAGLISSDGALGGIVWAVSRSTQSSAWGISAEAITTLVASAGTTVVAAVACA